MFELGQTLRESFDRVFASQQLKHEDSYGPYIIRELLRVSPVGKALFERLRRRVVEVGRNLFDSFQMRVQVELWDHLDVINTNLLLLGISKNVFKFEVPMFGLKRVVVSYHRFHQFLD